MKRLNQQLTGQVGTYSEYLKSIGFCSCYPKSGTQEPELAMCIAQVPAPHATDTVKEVSLSSTIRDYSYIFVASVFLAFVLIMSKKCLRTTT